MYAYREYPQYARIFIHNQVEILVDYYTNNLASLMIASPVQILFRGENRVIDSNSALLLGINLLIEIGR